MQFTIMKVIGNEAKLLTSSTRVDATHSVPSSYVVAEFPFGNDLPEYVRLRILALLYLLILVLDVAYF